ncbi:hypothetical protein SALBM217S_09880 [Streptomyces griseoloalbus]
MAPGPRRAGPPWPAGGGSAGQDARPYVYLQGHPRDVLQDRLSVTNPARTPLTVRLRDGPAGPWFRFAADTVTVPARTRADVPFALAVPRYAVPGGVSRGRSSPVGAG